METILDSALVNLNTGTEEQTSSNTPKTLLTGIGLLIAAGLTYTFLKKRN